MGERRTGMRRLIGAAVIVVIIFGAVALWFASVSSLPAVKIPTPVMPSPNAYDYYEAAGKAVKDGELLRYASDDRPRPKGSYYPGNHDRIYSLAEKEALLKKNSAALKTHRQGLTCRYMSPPIRTFDAAGGDLRYLYDLTYLLLLDGQVKAKLDDWNGAVGSWLDAMHLGTEFQRGSPMEGKLYGNRLQAMGRKNVWEAVDHLTANEAKSAARRLEQMISSRVTYAEALTEEKWATTASLINLCEKSGYHGFAPYFQHTIPSTNSVQGKIAYTYLAVQNRKKVIRAYMERMDKGIANARQPYAAKLPDPPIPHDPINGNLLHSFSINRFEDEVNNAQNALLMLTLALRAYNLEHGQYPMSLSELVPAYISMVPDDPFAMKGPIYYKLAGNGYVLYSLGPDCKDDGGKAIANTWSKAAPGVSASLVHQVMKQSTGDIVAGVNTQ